MKKNNQEIVQSFAMITQFGIHMLVPILACTLFGAWLGEKISADWLAIPFFAIGAMAGMRNVFQLARRIYMPKKNEQKIVSSDNKTITNNIKKEESHVKKTQ